MSETDKIAPLAFIDSGVGGLPYLAHLRAVLPESPLVYVADNLSFPYGNKSEDEIRMSVCAMVDRLVVRYQPELIVVACNTASVVALAELRARFPYDFVGVVPAIKPAALHTKTGTIGVLATERTIQGVYLDRLIKEFAPGKKVVRQAATELIQAIEDDPLVENHDWAQNLLRRTYDAFRMEGADTIVLGCTHFLHLSDDFHKIFDHGFTVLDSREGVTRQVLRVLEKHNTVSRYMGATNGDGKALPGGKGILHVTKPTSPGSSYEKVASRFGLSFSGSI